MVLFFITPSEALLKFHKLLYYNTATDWIISIWLYVV